MSDHDYGAGIFPQHAAMLAASGIDPDVARERGTTSVDTKTMLEKCHIAKPGRQVPGLLFPIHGVTGVVSWQYRPDEPRLNGDGKPVKYETPYRQPLRLDLHPRTHEHLNDPKTPIVITEGVKKVDALLSIGIKVVIGLTGVWNWVGTDASTGGKVALPDWRDVALNGRNVFIVFDHDVMRKSSVKKAATELAGFLRSKGATVWFLWLPAVDDDPATGIDDYLAAATDKTAAWKTLVESATEKFTPPEFRPTTKKAAPEPATFDPVSRDQVHSVFQRWFGKKYDLQYLDVVLAAGAAGMHLDGNPLWLQIIGGSGVGKTETTAALAACGARVVSTLSGPAALLSGTSRNERAADATGGILREIGDKGMLVIKDFTSILSMAREKRAEMLAGLREVFDGVYVRSLGSDGGQTLDWRGRVAVLSCVTGVYDEHYAVVAAMGERFLLVRLDSNDTDVRLHATRQALRNGGSEDVMREQMSSAVAGLLTNITVPADLDIDDDDLDVLVTIANVVSLARSQVARDGKGDPEYAHAPEMPTRIAQQLRQLLLGCRLIGMSPEDSMDVVRRVAHDTIPPDRRQVLLALHDAAHDGAATSKGIAAAVGMSRSKVDRTLQEMALHGLVRHIDGGIDNITGRRHPWTWEPTDEFDLDVLRGTHSGDVKTPPQEPPQEPTQSPDLGAETPVQAGRAGSTASGGEWGDFSGTDRATDQAVAPDVTPAQIGPCTRCKADTIRYGPGANPWCRNCQAVAS